MVSPRRSSRLAAKRKLLENTTAKEPSPVQDERASPERSMSPALPEISLSPVLGDDGAPIAIPSSPESSSQSTDKNSCEASPETGFDRTQLHNKTIRPWEADVFDFGDEE